MWLKVIFKNNIKITQILEPYLLEDGMSITLLDKIKKELFIPESFNLMYDFEQYIKSNTHCFYISKFIPEILQKLIVIELRNQHSLDYLQTLLHPDLDFTKWLKSLYNIENKTKFSLYII